MAQKFDFNSLVLDPTFFHPYLPIQPYKSATRMSVSSNSSESTVEDQKIKKCSNETKKIRKKQYPCSECLKNFNRPSALKTHMYTHTGEKPYSCSILGCNRNFSVISNLRRHLKVHKKPINIKKNFPEGREHGFKAPMTKNLPEEFSKNCLNMFYLPFNEFQGVWYDYNQISWLPLLPNYQADHSSLFRNNTNYMDQLFQYENLLAEEAFPMSSEANPLDRDVQFSSLFHP